MNKRAVSPVVATVLLISMVVVLAMIVILWFTSFVGEAITKFDGQNVEVVCRDIVFDADYSSGLLSVVNTGSVPIYDLKVKRVSAGGHDLVDAPNWPEKGLNQGKAYSSSEDYSGNNEIILIPVLIGESEGGIKSFVCDEEETGYSILI